MPNYNEGDENKFFPAVIAALLVIGLGLGTFIYSLINADPDPLDNFGGHTVEVEEIDGVPHVNPGDGLAVPDAAPVPL